MTTDAALTEQVAEAVRQALSDGEALQCTRVWEAWLYKTMTDEDFTDASDGPLVEEVTAAVLPSIRKAQAEAWAEGYNDGVTDTLNNSPVETPSPYAEYDLTEEAR
ncbi:hypothetical protein [Brachybacterium sp. FME24]|uniref:hypothetical protein n=1 Tax=Brachybacterium sp. FME24 TaxID=2742605 RepID=UPI001867B926|nr:hypothetical protein [Brachybacterium sp. FME24]